MEELLKKLMESDILNEETKSELEETINARLDEAVEAARKETEEQVRIELTEKYVQERDAMLEALDTKVNDFLKEEMKELRSDIENFRDLEAEYAERLVEAKAAMAQELQGDLGELVEKMDAFLEVRLVSELEEIREDIEEVKKLEFGRKIFEGIVQEYRSSFVDEDSVEAELVEARKELGETKDRLAESEATRDDLERNIKIDELLQNLKGHQRDVMEAVLEKMPTAQLEEGYATFLPRVMKENLKESDESLEKEEEVLAEGESKEEEALKEAVIETGDKDELKEEEAKNEEKKGLNESTLASIRALAGIGKK